MSFYKTYIISILISGMSVLSFGQTGNSELTNIKPPYNIKDYFLLLPDSMLKTFDQTVDLNQRLLALKYDNVEELWKNEGFWQITTSDYKNGYLKLVSTGDGAGTIFEITYFIKKDKTREIAVNKTYWNMAISFSTLHFYSYENEVWKDITNNVLPDINLSDFTTDEYAELLKKETKHLPVIYHLPQKGKNIKAEIDSGTIDNLFDDNVIDKAKYINIKKSLRKLVFVWNDGIFIIRN